MSSSAIVVGHLLASSAAWLLFFAGLDASAQGQTAEINYLQSEYIVDSWQTEQGLPDNSVNAIAQTANGYLWIATFNGLARFNGVEFVVFDAANTPELPSSRITDLKLDTKGRLWIRSEEGHLSLWAEGRFKAFTEGGGLTNQAILVIWEDHASDIWATTSYSATNYYHFDNDVFERVSSTNTFYHRFGKGSDIDGYGWGIRSNNLFCVHRQHPVETLIPGFRAPQGSRLTAARDGGMWVIAHRILKFHPTASDSSPWEDYGPLPRVTDQFGGYLEDRSGNLWIGTGVGELWRVASNHVSKRFKLPNSTTAELGKSIFEDAEGNLWIGNRGSGLLRLKKLALKTYDSRGGLKSDVVRSVTQDRDGNIWLATVNSVDWFSPHSSGTGGSVRAEPRGLDVSLPWNVYGARDGTIWIGTFSKGLFRFDGQNGTWFAAAGRSGAPPLNVIFEDHQGNIHLGTHHGLYGIEGDGLAKRDQPEGPMDIRSIAEDSLGQLYLGLNGKGLVRKTKKGWDRFTTHDGLAARHVWALYVDKEDSVWIGTHGWGLSRLKNGRFFNFLESQVELPRLINCIVEDDTGHLWFGSNQGLFRAERRRLNQLADARVGSAEVTRYAQADGMGSSQCTGSAWKARDGNLWFATMGGVTVVDPRALPFNTRPPPVVVEAVFIDDTPHSFSLSPEGERAGVRGQLKVPPGAHRLEFRYAALSFTSPDRVRFQYRLEGFDKDWVKANARRIAFYTKVPPGQYRFQVMACNNDNLWSKTAASLAVSVRPYFWQTGWFLVLAILCAGGLAVGAYKFRILRLERARLVQETFSRRLLQSQEDERKRIAAELHDSLGQSLLVVKNYAFMALKLLPLPLGGEGQSERVSLREQLLEISENTSASIEEVRSIARALRPYQLDRFGLTKTLEDAAELLAKAGSLRIDTEIDDVDNAFSPEAQISIFRVVQEWLNNVVKHARASTARLSVRKHAHLSSPSPPMGTGLATFHVVGVRGRAGGGLVRIILEDDGIGFDYAAVMNRNGDSGTFGLANLRERVRLLGGSLKIDTAPGKGTRLFVDLPFMK